MIVVRHAVVADLPAIVALLADDAIGSGRETVTEPLPAAYGQAFAAIGRQDGNHLLVADADGAVVGCLQVIVLPGLSRVGMTRAEIEGVRVGSAWRNRGIGGLLVAEAIRMARAAGAGLMQLTTDSRRIDAQRFYARLGFVASHVGMKLTLTADP